MRSDGDPDWDTPVRAIVEKDEGLWQVAVWHTPRLGAETHLGAYRTLKRAKAEAVKFWRKGTKMGSAFVKMGRGRLKRKPKWADED